MTLGSVGAWKAMSRAYSLLSSVTCDYLRSGVQADHPELHVFCSSVVQSAAFPARPPCVCGKGLRCCTGDSGGLGALEFAPPDEPAWFPKKGPCVLVATQKHGPLGRCLGDPLSNKP